MQRGLFQIQREVLGGLVAPLGALLETAADDPVDLQRDLRGQIRRIVVQDRGAGLHRRVSLEGTPTSEHLVKDGAGAEDVRAVVRLVTTHLLRGHVFDRPEDRPQLGARREGLHLHLRRDDPGAGQLGEAEVEDLQPSFVRDEEVLRLHVAVDHASVVRRRQTLRELDRVSQRLFQRQRLPVEPLAQRGPVEKLGDDVRARRAGPDVVDGEDVGVVERTRRSRLLAEAAQLVFAVPAGGEELDRHLSIEVQIPRDEDAAHPAASELPLDSITRSEIGEVGRSRGSAPIGASAEPLARNGRDHRATVLPFSDHSQMG